MIINVHLTKEDLIRIVEAHISEQTGIQVQSGSVKIETKSKQNFRSEWESADFRATYSADHKP